jgi:hypothetical protein
MAAMTREERNSRRRAVRSVQRFAAKLGITKGFDLGNGVNYERVITWIYNGGGCGYPACCVLFFLIWRLANRGYLFGRRAKTEKALRDWWIGLTDNDHIRCPECTLREVLKRTPDLFKNGRASKGA